MKNLIIGFFEALYVVYMLNWFKTTVNFAHPASYYENPLIYHPVDKLDKPANLVCKFGHQVSWLLAAYLIALGVAMEYSLIGKNLLRWTHIAVLVITAVLSLLNFNVVVYLLPVVLFEAWRLLHA